ncbi:NAD(P)-binding domain-containing protein [Nonomuraea sp. NPDC050643]|uniref:NAD(P)-dependent oxidoreductase n=1 Tax=Nonomuraea sp. NPDC050643 TaxID=3155660 RepID=UPI0033F22FEF
MTTDIHPPVTVIGLGSMGTALAGAFIDAGHPTTVWNRTARRAAPLAAKGAAHAGTVEAAVTASPLVITCLTTYDDTRLALGPAAAALAGRALVTLNSGTPAEAREMTAWATGHGARHLDGAVKNVPAAVGAPDTLLYYSGDRTVFDEHEATLRVLGGDTVHLGDESDLAALYETAVGATLLPALLGFFQGAAMVMGRGLEAGTLVPYSVKWMEMIISILPVLAKEIDGGDYAEPASSIGLFHAALPAERRLGEETGVDNSWQFPMYDLIERAVAEGRAEQSISALTELLRRPERAA